MRGKPWWSMGAGHPPGGRPQADPGRVESVGQRHQVRQGRRSYHPCG
jgi:hypothetical protein